MISVAIRERIATLAIDRGAAANAFALKHWDGLESMVGTITPQVADVVIVRSAHPTMFSAGADLREMAASLGDPAFGATLRRRMGAAIEAVAALPMPVVAAIDGGCFGAAVALILACDIRIASEAARFATPPARLGIAYPARDVARLSAQVGRGHAGRMLFIGETLDANTAARIGLVEVRAADAPAEALRIATAITGNAAAAVRALKATLLDPLDAYHDAAFDSLFAGEAFAERLTAFHARAR